MELESLEIRQIPSYMPRAGEYEGRIAYKGKQGKVEVNLNAELSRQILQVCAANMVETSKEIAHNLTVETLLAQPAQLEVKE